MGLFYGRSFPRRLLHRRFGTDSNRCPGRPLHVGRCCGRVAGHPSKALQGVIPPPQFYGKVLGPQGAFDRKSGLIWFRPKIP